MLLFTVIVLTYSCRPMYKSINGVNKKLNFNSKEDYKNFLQKKTKFDLDKFYFVNNDEFNLLLSNIVENKITYYYGVIEHGNLIASGSTLEEKNSCFGSIVKAINDSQINSKNIGNKKCFILNLYFKSFNNEYLKLNNNKKTIVFIYSYKLGKIANNISDMLKHPSIENNDYIIISIDNLSIKNI